MPFLASPGQFDEDDEYRLPGDEKPKTKYVPYQKPDTSEYMMKQAGYKTSYEYLSEGGYQYGPRKRKKKK